MSHCCIDGDYTGTCIIDENPRFKNYNGNDFHLIRISPCINRGTNVGAPSIDLDGDPRPFMGTADMGVDEYVGVHALEADTFQLSEATGGKVGFTLNGTSANMNRQYLLLGTVTGTAPGFPYPNSKVIMPLNWDLFTLMTLVYLNSTIFSGFLGNLDASGNAFATFDTQGPLLPDMVGVHFGFAYALVDGYINFVSNPVSIEVIP